MQVYIQYLHQLVGHEHDFMIKKCAIGVESRVCETGSGCPGGHLKLLSLVAEVSGSYILVDF